MKRFLVIPDKFKGSLNAEEVIENISVGIKSVLPDANITSILASDGGDGFLDAVARYIDLQTIWTDTVDPIGRPMKAPFGYDTKTSTAYIELARASGLVLLKEKERNPLQTSTYGTGLQIKKALELGAKRVFLGIGGSATNDGGTGIAKALGYRFLDTNGNDLKTIGKHLDRIASIKKEGKLDGVSFFAINDVNNPLYGIQGAAHVYAAQKGANAHDIERLDAGLRKLDRVVASDLGVQNENIPGAGSAGGTGYGLMTFFNADFISGIDFLLDLSKVNGLLDAGHIDAIITGEGAIDNQTLQGKLISGVVRLGQKYGLPVIAFCGIKELSAKEARTLGLRATIEIADREKPLDYNMQHAAMLLQKAVKNYFKTVRKWSC